MRLKMLVMWALQIWSPSLCYARNVRDGIATGFGESVPIRSQRYRAGVPTFREALRGRFDE